MTNEKGITLIALIIMIIVLIILASITMYSGTATVKYIKYTRIKAEMETMQSQVNAWYNELNNGNTEVEDYGEDVSYSRYSSAFTAAGVSSSDGYKLFEAEYIENTLGIEGIEYDYLINISERKVILAEGLEYQDTTYYTIEDFDISNIDSATISTIAFSLTYGTNPNDSTETDVFLYGLVFYDSNGEEVDISKFKIEYNVDGYWEEVLNPEQVTYNGYECYCIPVTANGTYYVRVTTDDGNVSSGDTDNFMEVTDL